MVVIGTDGMIVFRCSARRRSFCFIRTKWDGGNSTVNKAEGTPLPYDKDVPLRRECQHFVNA